MNLSHLSSYSTLNGSEYVLEYFSDDAFSADVIQADSTNPVSPTSIPVSIVATVLHNAIATNPYIQDMDSRYLTQGHKLSIVCKLDKKVR